MLKANKLETQEIAHFWKYPGSHVIDSFKKHLSKTGRPTSWLYHAHSKPPSDSEFEELISFEIPEKLRLVVGKAACPICSPNKPKYYDGRLAWFPDEGVIRSIGHECAKTLFGAEANNLAKSKRNARERKRNAEDFLLATLPQIGSLRTLADHLIPLARELDRVRSGIWNAGGKMACQNLAKSGAEGKLLLFEETKQNKVDRFGKSYVAFDQIVVGFLTVRSLGFLKNSMSIEARAKNTATALNLVNSTNSEEEALDFITTDLKTVSYIYEAEKIAKAAVNELGELKKIIAEAQTFLNPDNLINISKWAADIRSNSPIQFKYSSNYPSQLKIGRKTIDVYEGTKIIILPKHQTMTNGIQ